MSFAFLILSFVFITVGPGEFSVTVIETILELAFIFATGLKCHFSLPLELSIHKLTPVSKTIFHDKSPFSMIGSILESSTVGTPLTNKIPLHSLPSVESAIIANTVFPLLPLAIKKSLHKVTIGSLIVSNEGSLPMWQIILEISKIIEAIGIIFPIALPLSVFESTLIE